MALQARLGQPLSLAGRIQVFKQRPDFVCLPEYWLIDDSTEDHHRAALRGPGFTEYLSGLSEELSTCLIAGTIVEAKDDRLYNTCLVLNRGLLIGRYRKRYPMPGELDHGISPGSENLVVEVDGVRVAVLICSDVFHPELYDELADLGVDLVFVPTASPYRSPDPVSEKKARDQAYFVDGSRRSGAFVVKTCGVGSVFSRQLQGRSLVAAPWGILGQVSYDEEASERALIEILDIEEVRDFRGKIDARRRDGQPASNKPSENRPRS